jgi:uncharacterized phage protein (TIGR01671 family)
MIALKDYGMPNGRAVWCDDNIKTVDAFNKEREYEGFSYLRYGVLEQYTGRTAQCADEIYEHDICMVTRFDHNGADYQYKCTVEWCNGSFAFVNKEKGIFIPLWDVDDTDSDVEIIGNIHDNTELLEGLQ